MKIPICKCDYMLASKTISVYGSENSYAFRREEIAWVCPNKDCEEGKSGNFVEPRWFTVGIDPEKELK